MYTLVILKLVPSLVHTNVKHAECILRILQSSTDLNTSIMSLASEKEQIQNCMNACTPASISLFYYIPSCNLRY